MKYIITAIVLINFHSLYSQSLEEDISRQKREMAAFDIEQKLLNHGFENIKAIAMDSAILIAYENRIHRFEIEGLANVIGLLPKGQSFDYILIPHYQSIPLVSVEIKKEKFGKNDHPTFTQAFVDGLIISMNMDKWTYELSKAQFKNTTPFKFDFALGPVISATQFGNYNKHIQILLDAAPALHLQLRKGLSLNAQALFPIFNNLTIFNDEKLRMGLVNLTQHIRLKNNAFVTATVGNFNRRRMGYIIDFNKYFFNGQFIFGSTISGTTWSRYSGEIVDPFTERGNYLSARVSLTHRWSKYDLITKASYGTFMLQDRGWRIDMLRQFGQNTIGVYVTRSQLLDNAGFKIAFALPVKTYSSFKKKIRLRTTEYLRYEYKLTGNTYGLAQNVSSGESMTDQIFEIHPHFIKNQLLFLLNQ
ncbi:MAG: hypothetical protein ACI828_002617 [Flavobacteriales bacterium]|jgi:hypothetical protein